MGMGTGELGWGALGLGWGHWVSEWGNGIGIGMGLRCEWDVERWGHGALGMGNAGFGVGSAGIWECWVRSWTWKSGRTGIGIGVEEFTLSVHFPCSLVSLLASLFLFSPVLFLLFFCLFLFLSRFISFPFHSLSPFPVSSLCSPLSFPRPIPSIPRRYPADPLREEVRQVLAAELHPEPLQRPLHPRRGQRRLGDLGGDLGGILGSRGEPWILTGAVAVPLRPQPGPVLRGGRDHGQRPEAGVAENHRQGQLQGGSGVGMGWDRMG